MGEPIICDTSIWLYSGRIKQTHLLPKLYSSIYTTETVCWELDNGRLLRSDVPDPRQFPWVHIVQPEPHTISLLPANRLGRISCRKRAIPAVEYNRFNQMAVSSLATAP